MNPPSVTVKSVWSRLSSLVSSITAVELKKMSRKSGDSLFAIDTINFRWFNSSSLHGDYCYVQCRICVLNWKNLNVIINQENQYVYLTMTSEEWAEQLFSAHLLNFASSIYEKRNVYTHLLSYTSSLPFIFSFLVIDMSVCNFL
jgi:hypothetical protein